MRNREKRDRTDRQRKRAKKRERNRARYAGIKQMNTRRNGNTEKGKKGIKTKMGHREESILDLL